LGVTEVGFAAGDVLGIASIDQHHIKAALIENLKDWDPVDAGGLHRDRTDAAALQPIRQAVQVASERAEAAHRLGISIGRNRRDMHPGAYVDRGGIRVSGGYVPIGTGPLRSGHRTFSWSTERLDCASDQLPDRDRREGVTTLKCATAQGPRFLTGSSPP
jgi:hypothetical protein